MTTGDASYSSPKGSKETEVVDVVSGENCADLADFPLAISAAVGANLYGTPVVCGGQSLDGSTYMYTYHQTCYRYIMDAGWQQFASMKDKRRYAAGVMHKNKLHVFGGSYSNSYKGKLKTTEIISVDGGVEDGPELPEALAYHAITSINSTVSLLSGGWTTISGGSPIGYSPLTWFFNHETNVFSAGPSMPEGRQFHGSATCVDKVTKAEIPMVTGGKRNGFVTLDSTILLINGEWQSGTV